MYGVCFSIPFRYRDQWYGTRDKNHINGLKVIGVNRNGLEVTPHDDTTEDFCKCCGEGGIWCNGVIISPHDWNICFEVAEYEEELDKQSRKILNNEKFNKDIVSFIND